MPCHAFRATSGSLVAGAANLPDVVGGQSPSPPLLTTCWPTPSHTEDSPLSIAIELEGHCYSRLRSSEDFREGVEAFHSKRKPNFIGR